MYKKLNEYDFTLEARNSLIKKLDSVKIEASKKSCFLGFDGYVDSLYSVVQSRLDAKEWTRMESMKTFGELMIKVAGSSANVERVLKRRIFGGFAPNTCRAMNKLGVKIFLIAALGIPHFNEFYNSLPNVKSISLANPGQTLGLEFDNGKVMITDFEPILKIDWNLLLEKLTLDKLIEMLNESDIMGFGHWALVPSLNDIWLHFIRDLFPSISNLKKKIFFVDVADITKRSKKDITNLVKTLQKVDELVPVMLSSNDQEALRLSSVLDIVRKLDIKEKGNTDLIEGGKLINNQANISYLVIHSPHFATISTKDNHYWVSEGFTSKPKFTVAGGDHFHSGTALGLSCNLAPDEAILLGNILSAIFVRTGNSPDFMQVSQFLNRYIEFIDKDIPIFP